MSDLVRARQSFLCPATDLLYDEWMVDSRNLLLMLIGMNDSVCVLEWDYANGVSGEFI